jgi:hypothetical protein
VYGLPADAPLSRVVSDLCQPHSRTVQLEEGPVTGQEEPLLSLLERAIAADSGRGSASGGGSSASAPVDAGALTLWTDISAVVGAHWPGRGDLLRQHTPLIERLEAWTRVTADTPNEEHLLEMCRYWTKQIRDLLEPPKRVPLRGMTCPACECTHVEEHDADGGVIYNVSLLAHMSEEEIRAECLVCGTEWVGGELLDLRALAS